MATALVHYTAAAVSDRGRKRSSNEDAFGYSIQHGVYVLCDGMGGAAAGEVASSLAVEEMMNRLSNRAADAKLPVAAEQAVFEANEVIYYRAQRDRKLNGMGTTLVSLVVGESCVWVLNVGDSRCYLFRHGHIDQVTIDHSLVDEQVRLGRMTPEEALQSPLRNVITRALGTHSDVAPDVFELDAEPGDLFLLCSDGLTREVADPTIEATLALDLPLGEICHRLVGAANDAGGHDNITCMLVRAA